MKAPQPNKPPETQKVKVLRAFQDHKREVLQKGTEATLPLTFAREMKAANKVEFIDDPKPEAAAPAPAASSAASQQKQENKGGRNAA